MIQIFNGGFYPESYIDATKAISEDDDPIMAGIKRANAKADCKIEPCKVAFDPIEVYEVIESDFKGYVTAWLDSGSSYFIQMGIEKFVEIVNKAKNETLSKVPNS